MIINPEKKAGAIIAPKSKSHEHRLLIADFLAGDTSRLKTDDSDSDDIVATKRCLNALMSKAESPFLDCGESGSTLRFLSPIAAALGKRPVFKKCGHLNARPVIDYATIQSGEHCLPGDVSSQFVTGLLFALPLLRQDSRIVFTSAVESRGYIELTLDVLRGAGIVVEVMDNGYMIPGSQTYRAQPEVQVEGDWSGATFWLAMNALGSSVAVEGLNPTSAQPDRRACELLADMPSEIDISQFPDAFPALAIVAGARAKPIRFTNISRLRLKECDRVAAMEKTLATFGVKTKVEATSFTTLGTGAAFKGGKFSAFNDHRIAMAIATGATIAGSVVEIDNPDCATKSYPKFFAEYNAL